MEERGQQKNRLQECRECTGTGHVFFRWRLPVCMLHNLILQSILCRVVLFCFCFVFQKEILTLPVDSFPEGCSVTAYQPTANEEPAAKSEAWEQPSFSSSPSFLSANSVSGNTFGFFAFQQTGRASAPPAPCRSNLEISSIYRFLFRGQKD